MKPFRKLLFSTLTEISPALNTKVWYLLKYRKPLNMKNPQTLNEKLLWLKLEKYMNNPLVIQCADKAAVREYVEGCGCKDLLNDVIGIYDSADEIPWDELPNRFVLKWNFGAGYNIICKDKSQMDRNAVIAQMNQWDKIKYWLPYAEMQYKYIPHKIVCERFLENARGESLPDYKVYCFHGEPQAIMVMHDRFEKMTTEFFDTQWNALPASHKYGIPEVPTEKPKELERMLEAARSLSAPFPFVRCDFYVVDEKIYFGELTFTPAAGFHTAETQIHGKEMTEFLDIDAIRDQEITWKHTI